MIRPQVSSAVGAIVDPGAADDDPVARRGGDVDRGVPRAGGDQQLQVGEAVEDLGGERRALAHRDDDLGARQRLDQLVGVGDVMLDRDRLPVVRDPVPAAVVEGDALVVVEQDDAVHPASLAHG